LRHVFEIVVAQCIDAGLASGQRYAADASIIAADANRQQSTPKVDWDPEAIDPNEAPRAVREYLETLDGRFLAWAFAAINGEYFTTHRFRVA
jgi:hypothetical protein